MGVVKKKIVDGVVVEDQEPSPNTMVKTIENGVVVEKPFSQAIKKKEDTGVNLLISGAASSAVQPTPISEGSGLTKTGKTVDGIETVTIDEEPGKDEKKYYRGAYLSFPKQGSADIAAGAGTVAKEADAVASDATIKKLTSPQAISEYIKDFEYRTGAGTFDLGSDLPQIKETRDEEKFLKYQGIEKRLDSIGTGEGDLKDFDTIKRDAPRLFENVKNQLGIQPDITQGEDDQVWDVFTQYKSKVFDDRLEVGRERRKTLTSEMEGTLPLAAQFTGQQYNIPTSIEEAKKIFSDLDQKKAEIALMIENSGGSLTGKMKQIEEAGKAIAEAEKARPALIKTISGMLFEEQSKLNPNLEPFELGKKIYQAIDPKGYELYQAAGGDELYGDFGSGFDDSPKKADAINRYITNLGIDAFNTFGNKAAIERADLESKTLGWKYTRPLQEETRHMIAAELHRQGIKPHKASEAEKDAIAETLPEINRDIWFDQNKSENNISLPSTGFGKSLGGSYHHTIEDATKGLLGWMMPNRGRERALDVLEQQSVSDVIGENPETRARLSSLRETEGKRALTDEEKSEKEYLEKFNDVRTGWQKFKDLSGSGVGQFAGFGTIAAFTGGLGNVRTPIQAVKALISPMAGRKGMLAAGYLMSREQNARDAVQMFPGEDEGIARFVYGETASAIDTFVERLFPEERYLSGVFKKEAKSLIPSLTAKNLRSELNENLASKISKSIISKVGKQQATPLQEGIEEMLAAKIKDTFHGILDPSADAMTLDDIVNVGTQAYLSSQLLGVPKGLMATRNPTVPLNAIWDAASDKKTFFDVKRTILEMEQKGELTTEEAAERISLLTSAQKLYNENPVLSGNMGAKSLPKRQNYLGRLLHEEVLQREIDKEEEKTVPDKNVIKELKGQISESEKARQKIFYDELEVNERNKESEVLPEIKKANDQWRKNIVAIGERTDIDDTQKELLKQDEDARHAKEVADLTKDATLLSQIKSKQEVGGAEKEADLQYFIDKAGEAPLEAARRFGKDETAELLQRVPTEKLEENYKFLSKIDPESKEAIEIDRILTEREKASKPEPDLGFDPETNQATSTASKGEQVGNIESKKADIEKRRKDELKGEEYRIVESSELYKDNEGNFYKVSKLKNGKTQVLIADENGKTIGEIGTYDKELSLDAILNGTEGQYGTRAATNSKLELSKIKDLEFSNKIVGKINEKYDAELAALEKQTPKGEQVEGKEVPKREVLKLSGKFVNPENADRSIEEIKSLGKPNPFNDNQVVIDNVKVNVERDGGKIWLKEISSIEQGKGEGTKVLNKIKEIADQNDVDIILHPTAIKNTTEQQLTKWYKDNGFEDYTQGRLIYKSQKPTVDETAPIRQLGTGANVYFETKKYRVNDDLKSGKVLLNIGDAKGEVPLKSVEFKDAKEAVFVAKKLEENAPKGLDSDYHNVDKIIDNFRDEYKNQDNLEDKGKGVTSPRYGKAENIPGQKAKGASNTAQAQVEESPEKLNKRYERVIDEFDVVDPYDVAVKYFADGGKINPSELERIFGGKGDKGARISRMKNNAGTVKQIAHFLWESDQSGKYEDTHYIDAIESALRDYPSQSAMKKDLADRYDLEGGYEKFRTQQGGNQEDIDVVERMSDDEMNEVLRLDAENSPDRDKYIDDLIKTKQDEKEKTSSKESGEKADSKKSEGRTETSGDSGAGRTDTGAGGSDTGTGGTGGATDRGTAGGGDTGNTAGREPSTGGRDAGDGVGITHAQTTEIANQLGFSAYEKDPETVEQWDKEADERIKKGGIGAVIEKLEKSQMPTDVEQRMIAKYVAELKAQVEKNPTNEKLSELKYVIELSDIVGGREVAKSLVARKGTFYADESLSGYLIREMEEEGVSELTEGQKTTAKKEFEDISKARKEFDEWRAQKEAELNEREATLAVEEMKKKRGKRSQDLAKQRSDIIDSIAKKWKDAGKDGVLSSDIPFRKQINAIKGDVLKLAKNLVDTGVNKLADLRQQVIELLKNNGVNIDESGFNQIMAGKFDEPKPTKNELTATWRDLREEAKLVERLEALERGEIPVTEKKRIERNREITDLRNKIKEHKVTKQVAEDKKVADLKQRLSDLDEGKAVHKKTPQEISAERKELQKQIKEHEVTRLNEAKTRIKANIDRIQDQLNTGDFSKKEKPKVTLDEEGRKLQKKLIELQKKREIRIEKNRYDKRTRRQKNMDLFSEIINIPRSVMASVDFSAPLNQAAIATTAYPIEAAAAVKQMFKSARSQEEFDRWFYEMKDSPRYELYKDSGLKISDPHSAFLSAREEQFISGLAEKGTKWGFNKVGLKIDPIGGSNRAYTQYLNKMRVDLFNKFINKFEDDGKTYKKNKELYDKTARYVNNITGAGSIGKLEEHAGLFNAVFFSPRLIASRLNLLKPWYWHSLPKEIRGRYFADMGKYLGVRMALIGSMVVYRSLLQGDDDPDKITIETDSRSSDFMKIRQGNTRWDMWGGFQPYVRIVSQLATGQRKTTTSGEIQEFDSDIPNRGMGKNILNFGRSKLAPFWGALWNLAEGENVVGEKYTLKSALFSNLVPLSMQSAWEGKDQHGLYTPLKVLAPSVFGIGVSTYAPRKKEVKDEVTYRKKEGKVTVEYKVDLSKEQYKEYEDKARKYMERDLKKMEATKEYQQSDNTEQASIKRNIENAAIRKAEKEIVDKYKRTFKLNPEDKEKAEKAERLKKVKEKVD